MRYLRTGREMELLSNAKRSLEDCLIGVKAGQFQEGLRVLLIGLDTLANLEARANGKIATEKEAARDNRRRFIAFLRHEIPEWKEYEMQWEGRTIPLDLSELSYEIRCKQLHEYSDLSSAEFPIRLEWNRRLHGDPAMWIHGRPGSRSVACVEVNGFHLLQRLVEVAQKYIGIFSSTPSRGGSRIYPYTVYELLGTVKSGRTLNRFGFPSDDPDAVW